MQPYELTIAEAAQHIRSGALSPLELTNSVLDRIEAVDDMFHAYATVTAEKARTAALQAERALTTGADLGPLHGIPMGIKDVIDTAGVATTCSSAVRAGHVPSQDATVVKRLAEAGSVLLGKTYTHEFAYGLLTPTTRNPWDPRRIPGGSSGGSAAAVAAGMALFAIGTDTGGSVRVPAALCGTVGLKCTYGRVSRHGVTPLSWSLDTIGPITRTVTDAAHVLSAISGYDSRDAASADVATENPLPWLESGVQGLTVGIPTDHFFERVAADVAELVHQMADRLAEAGAILRDVSVPDADVLGTVFWTIMVAEASAYHEQTLRSHAEFYQQDVRELLRQGLEITAVDYIKALRVRAVVRNHWRTTFEHIDALLAPAAPITAPAVGQSVLDWISSKEDVTSALVRLNCPANVIGLPAVTVPCGLGDDKMPVGVQIIGKPFDEHTVLRIGRGLEQVSTMPVRIPTHAMGV